VTADRVGIVIEPPWPGGRSLRSRWASSGFDGTFTIRGTPRAEGMFIMETMGRKQRRRRSFTRSSRRKIVGAVPGPVTARSGQVAKDFDLTETAGGGPG